MSTFTNFIGNLKNNIRSKKEYVDINSSLLIEKCLGILLNEGYILGYSQINSKTIRIRLKYYKGRSVINDLGFISLPGFRKYWKISDILKNYNKSTLVILSTPNGVLSDKHILFKRRSLTNKFIYNPISHQASGLFSKNYKFLAIEQPIKLSYKSDLLFKNRLNDVMFHKVSILKAIYRRASLFNKLSKRQYIRNRNIRFFYKTYVTKSFCMYNSLAKAHDHLTDLTFFKFKKFFSSSSYLIFRKSKNFVKCLNYINSIEFYSIFYFIFYSKQLSFTRYRYRFSLYIKYLNHLMRVFSSHKNNSVIIQNKLNMGGEPLLYVR